MREDRTDPVDDRVPEQEDGGCDEAPCQGRPGPTIAFCTALEMMSRRTKSKAESWPSWRLPVRRSPTSTATYTTVVRRAMLSRTSQVAVTGRESTPSTARGQHDQLSAHHRRGPPCCTEGIDPCKAPTGYRTVFVLCPGRATARSGSTNVCASSSGLTKVISSVSPA